MREDVLVTVRPLGEGWVMDCNAGLEPVVFGSGAKAEAQAHAIASRIARVGTDTRVLVHDRGERLVGTTRYLADEDRVRVLRPSGGSSLI